MPDRPSPFILWQQAQGDSDRYRELLREHGHLVPGDEGYEEAPRTLSCGWPGNRVGEDQDRPLILIDVDGVLNPSFSAKTRRRLAYHGGWVQKRADAGGLTFRLFVNPEHGLWLRKLAEETGAELAWGTTWEEYANPCVGPLLHLPPLRFAPVRDGAHKADGIVPWTQGRPFVWFDDEPDAAEATARLAGDQPHLVVYVPEEAGLAVAHIERARTWLTSLPRPRGEASA